MSSCGGGNGKLPEKWVSVSNTNHEQGESSKTGIQEMGNESDKLVVMIKPIEQRLSVLEEEDEVLKESIFRSMEERKILMNEILQQFQDIYNQLNGSIIIQEREPNSSSVQALKEGKRPGLVQVLWQDSNPSLISSNPIPATATSTGNQTMEVEVKLRLPDSATHQRVSDILSPHHVKTLFQENVFFDGVNSQLSSNLAALRLRFYDFDSHCVLSLKSKPALYDGISRIEEEEEPLEPSIARACVAEPWRLCLLDSAIMKKVRVEYGIGDELVCLGGFKNVRAVYDWNGLKLELDESRYDFGTCFELECESSEPENVRKLLEELLLSNGIQYSYSKTNKFAVFLSGKLPL